MSALLTAVSMFLLSTGAIFVFLGAVGVVRMPDLYMRLQTTSKSITLGATCVLLGAAVHFADAGMAMRSFLIIAFLLMTTPIAAHVLSRAAYISGIRPAAETHPDELAGRYDRAHHLASPDANAGNSGSGHGAAGHRPPDIAEDR